MAHVRTQVRNKIKELVTNAVNWKIFDDMSDVNTSKSYPAVFIQSGVEAVERIELGRVYAQQRVQDITLLIATLASNAQNLLEEKLLLIEKAIAENQTLNNSVQSVSVENISFDVGSDNGTSKVSIISISLSVEYRTMNNDLETFI